MKTKNWAWFLVLSLWIAGTPGPAQTLRNQVTIPGMNPAPQPNEVPLYPAPSPLTKNGVPESGPATVPTVSGGLSDWIVYRRECCEGAHGRVTPLYTELYLQAGPSFPVGTTVSRELTVGWSIAGGARALFFNEVQSAAWVVDAHLINTNEGGGGEHKQFPVTFFHKGVRSDLVIHEGVAGRKTFSIQDSNRTMVGLGFGRDWFPWKPADSDGRKLRIGLDGGGRYGSQRINFNEFGHITDVVAGIYAGGHADVEVPWHGLIWHAGVRFEWAYTWSDNLQTTSDIQDLNLFFTVGFRF